MSARKSTVLVISANEHFKEVIGALLARQTLVLRACVSNADQALATVTLDPPDITITDRPPLSAHDVLSLRAICERGSRLLVLARYMNHSADVLSFLAGASGLVLVPEGHLADAVSRVAEGEVLYSAQLSGYLRALVSGETPTPLNGEERRILNLISQGNQDNDIAAHLGVTPAAVRDQIARIAEKLM